MALSLSCTFVMALPSLFCAFEKCLLSRLVISSDDIIKPKMPLTWTFWATRCPLLMAGTMLIEQGKLYNVNASVTFWDVIVVAGFCTGLDGARFSVMRLLMASALMGTTVPAGMS